MRGNCQGLEFLEYVKIKIFISLRSIGFNFLNQFYKLFLIILTQRSTFLDLDQTWIWLYYLSGNRRLGCFFEGHESLSTEVQNTRVGRRGCLSWCYLLYWFFVLLKLLIVKIDGCLLSSIIRSSTRKAIFSSCSIVLGANQLRCWLRSLWSKCLGFNIQSCR